MTTLESLAPSIQASMEKWAVPGMAIGVLTADGVEAVAFGVRDLETGEPVTTETIFGIGSISKVFTATLAARLADQGRLDLDAPINDVLPDEDIPASISANPVTLRHLLTHTSGLAGDGFADHGGDDHALRDYIRSLHGIELVFAPGEDWSYANTGSCIAGHVMACAEGETYEHLIRTQVLDPMNLTRTGFGQAPLPDDVATGYDHGPGEDPAPRPAGTTWRSANPAGGMNSTVGDMLRFAAVHMGDGTIRGQRFMGADRLRDMHREQARLTTIDTWGLGWARRVSGGRQLVEHGGWMDGYRAQLTLIPDTGGAIAILNNGGYGHAANEEILVLLLEHLFGVGREAPEAIRLDHDLLRAYAGRYTSSHIDVAFRVDGDQLRARYTTAWHENDGADIALDPVTTEEFIIRDGEFEDSRVVFLPGLREDTMALRFLNRVLFRQPEIAQEAEALRSGASPVASPRAPESQSA